MIKDIIFIQNGEKFQITYREISNKNDILTVEPKDIVLEDIANAVSDLPIDDRTTSEPGKIDELSKLEMELWLAAYIAGWKKELADQCLEDFRETFEIVVEPAGERIPQNITLITDSE